MEYKGYSIKDNSITISDVEGDATLLYLQQNEGLLKKEKIVNMTDFVEVLMKKYNREKSAKLNNILDPNIVSYAENNNNEYICLYYYPAQTYDWWWNSIEHKEVFKFDMPALLYKVDYRGSCSVYAIDAETRNNITMSTRISSINFSNITNGSICYGTFKRNELKVENIKEYIDNLMATPFSHKMINVQEIGDKHYQYLNEFKKDTINDLIRRGY